MSRTAFFLAGILMGGAFGLSLLLGHESQWVPFGPFFWCYLVFDIYPSSCYSCGY